MKTKVSNGKSVNAVLSPLRDGNLFCVPVKSCLHFSFWCLCPLFCAGVWRQDRLLVLCAFPWGTHSTEGSTMSRDAHRSSGTHHGADGVGPNGHKGPQGPWGHQGSPTAYPVVHGGRGRRQQWDATQGLWAALGVEQGALTPTESFLHHQQPAPGPGTANAALESPKYNCEGMKGRKHGEGS